MQLTDILGLSAMVLFFGGFTTAMWIGKTAQKKKIVSLSLYLDDRKSVTYIVQETIPYDKIEWHLEKKQKIHRSKFEQIVGIRRYESVRGITCRPAGKIVIAVDGKLILEYTLNFMVMPEVGESFYADDVIKAKGVESGCLYSGNIVSVEISCIETPFDVEVYFCTSVKAKLLGYKQSS